MDLRTFEQTALAYWESIPASYREGVSRVVVEARAYEDVEAFGEGPLMGLCEADPVMAAIPEAPIVSVIRIFHGSFERVAEEEDGFDWEAELWETVRHELQHHLEWRAGGDELGEHEDLERENERRLMGESFEPGFHRRGSSLGGGAWQAAHDLFVEVRIPHREWGRLASGWAGSWHALTLEVPPPDDGAVLQDALLYAEAAAWARDDPDAPLPWDGVCVVFHRGAWWWPW